MQTKIAFRKRTRLWLLLTNLCLMLSFSAREFVFVSAFLVMSCCSSSTSTAGVGTISSTATFTCSNTKRTGTSQQQQQQQPLRSRTFYRRPLPDSCIAFSSQEGVSRFTSALQHQGLKSFFKLTEQFTTQSEPAFCGISTLVIVLNALAVDPRRTWKGPWRWYEESHLNCCLDLETIKESGITIPDFRCLAKCQGLAVQAVLVQDLILYESDNAKKGEPEGLEQFRQAIRKACVAPLDDSHRNDPTAATTTTTSGSTERDEILVVSYSRKVLSQTGSGHFSPVAAYDSASDSVLILDTARFKYGAHWVSVPLLFDAMKPIDPATGKSRGYMLLSDHDQTECLTSEMMPSLLPSVLFRSQRKDNPIRREYREYLSTKIAANINQDGDSKTTTPTRIDLDHVISFWTKQCTEPSYIWNMMEPQFTPLQDDEASLVLLNSVRSLVDLLLQRVPHETPPKSCCQCRVNFGRTIDLSPLEAIFVVYLASMDKQERQKLVLSVGEALKDGNASTEEVATAQTQLLAEAELVQHAIEMSGEI